MPVLPFAVLAMGTLLEKGRGWVAIIFVGLLPVAIFVQMLGVGVNFNTHLANVTHFLPGWDADYNFIPAFSPIRGNFELFWKPENNVIRALTLEQIGLNARMAKVFTAGAWAGFILSTFMLCYGYHSAKRATVRAQTLAGANKKELEMEALSEGKR